MNVPQTMVGVITSAPTPQDPTTAPVMMGINYLGIISVRVRIICLYMFIGIIYMIMRIRP